MRQIKMDGDKAGARCHLHMDSGRLNRHKCCEVASKWRRIAESVSDCAIVVGSQQDVKYTLFNRL